MPADASLGERGEQGLGRAGGGRYRHRQRHHEIDLDRSRAAR
jgi:hypothetical protein